MSLWTSYPAKCALDLAHAQLRRVIDGIAVLNMQHCYIIEVTSMLERVLNYGSIDNVPVIGMDIFYLSAVVLRGSLPWLSPAVQIADTTGRNELSVCLDR